MLKLITIINNKKSPDFHAFLIIRKLAETLLKTSLTDDVACSKAL